VAEFVALALDGPEPNGEVIDVGGPEALSPLEVARLAEDIGGRPIDIERIPIETLQRARATATDDVEASLIAQRLFAAGGHVVPMAATLTRLPVRLTPIREYVRGVL
jgi:nucleoside-diphosphate-sugar epimerase